MGAAEFEFGEVPKALNKIANTKPRHMKAFHVDILLSKVPEPWSPEKYKKGYVAEKPPRGAKGRIYVLCNAEWADEVTERIFGWATEDYNGNLKESTKLAEALRPPPEERRYSRVAGWLELDNGFMFFTDQTMWYGACQLFGVTGATLPEATEEVDA
jgi:hypothetical protein